MRIHNQGVFRGTLPFWFMSLNTFKPRWVWAVLTFSLAKNIEATGWLLSEHSLDIINSS